MGMNRLHEREFIVTKATNAIREAILDATKDLTFGEKIRAVNEAGSSFLASVAKWMIREERHPGDPDKPGGLT